MRKRPTFGILPDGQPVDVITLGNTGGMQLRVITYGCVIVGLDAPDRHGRVASVVLGYDTPERYVAESPYYGAVIGRYANRIAHANEPPHHLRGGFKGFDKRVWHAEALGNRSGIVFRRWSPDGEEGYAGSLDAQVTYTCR